MNNSLNRQYKNRLLAENHKLGLQSKAQELDNMKSEQQDRQLAIKTADTYHSIRQEIMRGENANQLRWDNKKVVEAQNFNIKQPQLAGDVFDPSNYREKGRPLNGPIKELLETIKEDGLGGSTLHKNYSVLSFKDKMMDHRKTNFPMGNEFSNYFPADSQQLSRTNIISQSNLAKYRTIDVNQSETDLPRKLDEQQNVPSAIPQGAHFSQTTKHGSQQSNYRVKLGFDRPGTAQDQMTTVNRLRNVSEYRHNKRDGERSKIQMGDERRAKQGTPSNNGSNTDYRSNFQWTVPKFAM